MTKICACRCTRVGPPARFNPVGSYAEGPSQLQQRAHDERTMNADGE
jgi:hypothetical protein